MIDEEIDEVPRPSDDEEIEIVSVQHEEQDRDSREDASPNS